MGGWKEVEAGNRKITGASAREPVSRALDREQQRTPSVL